MISSPWLGSEEKDNSLFPAEHRRTQHRPDVCILVSRGRQDSRRHKRCILALDGGHACGRWGDSDLHVVPQGTPQVTSALSPLQRDCFRPGLVWQSIWREKRLVFIYLNCLPQLLQHCSQAPENCLSHTWIIMLVVARMSFLFPSCSRGAARPRNGIPSSCSLTMALHKQSHSCVVTLTSHSACVHGKQTRFPSHRAQVACNNCLNQWHLLTVLMIPFLLSCSGAKIKLLIRGSQYFPLLSHQMALTSSQKHADTFLPLNLGGIRQGVKPLEGLLGWEPFYCNGNGCPWDQSGLNLHRIIYTTNKYWKTQSCWQPTSYFSISLERSEDKNLALLKEGISTDLGGAKFSIKVHFFDSHLFIFSFYLFRRHSQKYKSNMRKSISGPSLWQCITGKTPL